MDLDFFEKIGLKEKEARVYIALLKYSPSLANQVAKKSGILRSSIYDYLDVLLEKGFATYTIKSGKKFFQATSPEKIIENFEEQKGRKMAQGKSKAWHKAENNIQQRSISSGTA